MDCRLLTDPGGGWLEIGSSELSPRAVPLLTRTGNHRMTDRHVYVEDETMGDTFVRQFGLRIVDHVHYPARCPVRDYLPFDADLLRHGFVGAQALLRNGQSGRVMAVAPVTFEGAQQPTDCLVVSLGGENGEPPRIEPVPMAKAGFYIEHIQAGPAHSPDLGPEPTPGPRR